MSKIVAFCNGIDSTCIFIVGDFNADISKTSVFGNILHDFCNDFSFSIADKDYLPAETYTYVSLARGTTSWLDHVRGRSQLSAFMYSYRARTEGRGARCQRTILKC